MHPDVRVILMVGYLRRVRHIFGIQFADTELCSPTYWGVALGNMAGSLPLCVGAVWEAGCWAECKSASLRWAE